MTSSLPDTRFIPHISLFCTIQFQVANIPCSVFWRHRFSLIPATPWGEKNNIWKLIFNRYMNEKLSPCLKQYTSCRFIGRIISCLRATYNSSETLWWRKNTTFYSIALQKLLFIAPIASWGPSHLLDASLVRKVTLSNFVDKLSNVEQNNFTWSTSHLIDASVVRQILLMLTF